MDERRREWEWMSGQVEWEGKAMTERDAVRTMERMREKLMEGKRKKIKTERKYAINKSQSYTDTLNVSE